MEVCFISYACKCIPYSEIDESFCTCYRRRFFKIRKMHIKCLTRAFNEIFHPVRLPLYSESRARFACGSESMLNETKSGENEHYMRVAPAFFVSTSTLTCSNFFNLQIFRSFDQIKADKSGSSCVLYYDETIIYYAKLFLPFSSELFLRTVVIITARLCPLYTVAQNGH